MLGHRLGTTLVAIVAIALPLVACGGDDDAGGDTTTTEPPKTTTTAAPTTTLSPEQQAEADVRAAYDAYWDMSERLAAAPDPQDPEIAERMTGSARDAVTTQLTELMATGQAVTFGDRNAHDVTEVTVEGGTARVRDCHVEDGRRYDVTSGETTLEALATVSLDIRLTHEGDAWKVSELRRTDAWEGEVACE
jgi:hypothetical protein